jgi:hypothetical protein
MKSHRSHTAAILFEADIGRAPSKLQAHASAS